ncbi:MAG: DNA-3-methyladenine glycosylase [Acidobacteria bacterium]|nr:DNA-3-methyladenine glycosylase [Acidobacteriota bacterium]
MEMLARQFYLRTDTLAIARDLIGKLLIVQDPEHGRVSGMIVETEAYLGEIDRAAHSYGGRRTARNEITYAAGGHTYVFFVYGMYFQLNIVCGPEDSPHVCLIRAVEPVENIELMRERRKTVQDLNLTSGPGKLCVALGINKSFNGADLLGNRIWLEDFRTVGGEEVGSGKRVGIDYAGEFAAKPWRFWLKGNKFVSR